MAEPKLFAGPRVRRIRNSRGLTQTAMAEGLGISPSYLNLIERNQRPITVQLVLKLASVYRVDPEELRGDDSANIAALRDVFADPLLSRELPADSELVEMANASPNVALAMIKLYRAYREQADRLVDISGLLASGEEGGVDMVARLPLNDMREALEHRPNYYPALDEAAEAFTDALDAGDDLFVALRDWFHRNHSISLRILPVAVMPNWRRRFDRHSQRLFISERLSLADRTAELATEIALVAFRETIAAELDVLPLAGDEARRLARIELARYAAHALIMPYGAFLSAARRLRYDLDALAARFHVSYQQAATRLTTLARDGDNGVPFFLLETDHAGNILRRAGAEGFPRFVFGGECPRLQVYGAFTDAGRLFVDAVETPDGNRFLTLSRTIDWPYATEGFKPRRTALLLGCALSHAEETVYASALSSGLRETPTAIGRGCRICERQFCPARAAPLVTRPLGLDELVSGHSAFDFQ